MIRNFSFSTYVLLTGLAVILVAEPALAELEEIVVTARKRNESLQDTPISITAMTSDQLKLRGINDASEIADYTPNLVFDFT